MMRSLALLAFALLVSLPLASSSSSSVLERASARLEEEAAEKFAAGAQSRRATYKKSTAMYAFRK